MLQNLIGRNVKLNAYVNSKTLFDTFAKDSHTSQRTLHIDISKLRDYFCNDEVKMLGWHLGCMTPVDRLTKQHVTTIETIWDLLATRQIALGPCAWASVANKKESLWSLKWFSLLVPPVFGTRAHPHQLSWHLMHNLRLTEDSGRVPPPPSLDGYRTPVQCSTVARSDG